MADNVAVSPIAEYTVTANELADTSKAQAIQLLASDAANADDRVPASETDGLLVNLGANNDVTISDGGGSITVDGTVAVSGTVPVSDAGGSLTVDGPLTNTELRATAVPVSGTVTANAGTGTQAVGGVAATDAAVSGNPVYAGGRASTATPAAVSADNDVAPMWVDRNGAQMMRARPAATATLANVSGSASSVTLRAASTSRLGLTIVNDSAAICYVKLGSTASATSYTYRLDPGATLELPTSPAIYTGIVTGIWTSATGSARVTELTA